MWQRVCNCFLRSKQHKDARAGSEEPLLQVPESECEESSDEGQVAQPLPLVIRYDQYREPVLEYEDIQWTVYCVFGMQEHRYEWHYNVNSIAWLQINPLAAVLLCG